MSFASLAAAAKAAALGGRGAVRALELRGSGDLECRNLMCERLGEACACRLARFVQQTPLRELETLDVSESGLRALPGAVYECLPALRELRAGGNALQDIAPDVRLLTELRVLDLSRNRISALPLGELLGLPRLERLVLVGNPAAAALRRSMPPALAAKTEV